MYDVVALGELLVDFGEVPAADGVLQFAANPGGAPCNVLSLLSRHHRRTAFIGRVGEDLLGRYLTDTIRQLGIDVSGVTADPDVRTTLAFVATDASGERSFSFFRNPGADCCLSVEDVPFSMIAECRIFHFGTLSMTHESARAATTAAIREAKKAGALLSFDPNYRAPLWPSEDLARAQMAYGCSVCDVLKIERSELTFLTGITSETEAVKTLFCQYPVRFIAVTAGADGASLYTRCVAVHRQAVPVSPVVDTTGAGDAFWGVCLDRLLDHGPEQWTKASLEELLTRACTGASLVIQKKGALSVMPTKAEIDSAIAEAGRKIT
ncbi:MAG: carbohydrate kinase [Oscillospiraceae bacterium]|nr:carbohydrate kinase [Oscillospiraceae bacterium]